MLLAEIAFGKFCLHLPLHRQSRAFAREGVEIDVSTLADWMGAVSVALKPMVDIIEAHVLAAQRLHVDDTPVPVLAKGKTKTGRLWASVRDDRPFGSADLPELISSVHARLSTINEPPPEPALVPAVPVKRSIQPGHLVCLYCGKTSRRSDVISPPSTR